MNKEFIETITDYLDKLDNLVEQDAKNSIEKINVITKIEELIYWLLQYENMYLEEE